MLAGYERRYFLAAADGQTYGPYPAAQLAQMFAAGQVDYTTPVCGEGDQQWTTLAVLAPHLGIVPPPPRPGTVVRPPAAQPRSRRRSDSLKPVRLCTLLAAIGLFFLPWLEFRCAGRGFVQQTGFQTIAGDADVTSSIKEMAKQKGRDFDEERKLKKGPQGGKAADRAWLVVAAAVVILLALLAGAAGGTMFSGGMALLAAALIGTQMVTGFPMENDFKKAMKDSPLELPPSLSRMSQAPPGSSEGVPSPGPFADARAEQKLKREMIESMTEQMKPGTAYLPWLWGELGLLVVYWVLCLTAPRP